MKRFHVHLSVPDLAASIRFYSGLFGAPPSVTKDDYAKWMLDDPRVNFAISKRGNGTTGLNHLGLQVESEDELGGVRRQFEAADASSTTAEPAAKCCYAYSNKHWVQDPQGIPWEAFHSLDSIPVWGDSTALSNPAEPSTCCAPGATSATSAAGATASTPESTPRAKASCCAPASTSEPAKSCC
jgi:catechol 2,3-dioxygenase-like lactoylglutathione lyase family enzyme